MEPKLSDQRIFEILSRDKNFFKYYLDNYFIRLSSSNKDLIKEIFLEFSKKSNIYPNDLLELANLINKPLNKEGYRESDLNNNLIITVESNKVFRKLYSLLDSYRSLWKDLHVLEKESFLHIHLMRIYPFIHNNELICQLVLITNLIKNNYPPVIIDESDKEVYYRIINAGDALKFKNIIEEKIKTEMFVITDLYKKYYLFPEHISIDEIILKKSQY